MNNEQKNVWDRALSYVATSKTIRRMIPIHVSRENAEEFLSFLIFQLTERKPEKIIHAYENGYIDWMCLKIIHAQASSRRSKWNLQWNLQPLVDNEVDEEMLGILPIKPSSLVEIDTSAIYEDGDFDLPDNSEDPLIAIEEEGDKLFHEKQMKEIVNEIKKITKEFTFYSQELWRLHYDKGMKPSEIAKKTGINYNSVYKNIKKNKSIIKEKLLINPLLKKTVKKLLNE